MAPHCDSIISDRRQIVLLRTSLKFDGAEILLNPFHGDFKSTAEREITENSGFDFNVVGEARLCLLELVAAEAISVKRLTSPPRGSILYAAGSCIFLSLYRVLGGGDLCGTFAEVTRGYPISGPGVWKYGHCIVLLDIGDLRPADIGDLKARRNYLAHADGNSEGPHCVSLCVVENETLRNPGGNL